MKIKMVEYFISNNSSNQIFATFEYQQIKFDMFKSTQLPNNYWRFLEDESYEKLKKITNVELIERNCGPYLNWIDRQF